MPSVLSNLPRLRSMPCTGAGKIFMAPGPVVAVMYNGVLLPRGQAAPTLSYSTGAGGIQLNFTIETGDRIDALCIA